MSIYEYVRDVIHFNKTIITVDTLFYILQTYLKISVTFSIISCRRVSFSFKAFLFSSVLILCLVNSSLSCSKFFCLLSSFISLKSFRSTRALKNELVLVLWGCKPRYWVQFPVDVMNHFQFSTLVSRSNFFSHLFLHSSTVNTPFPTCHPNSKYAYGVTWFNSVHCLPERENENNKNIIFPTSSDRTHNHRVYSQMAGVKK